ncbi:hypothetical protein I0D68_15100 [Pseudomonas lalucatii]|nr:hypothetical protein I0D68_15100 [Pseudomonas lalucatii]
MSADRLQALRSESWRVLSAVLLDYDALAGQLALEQRERQLASLEVMTSLMRAPSLAPLAGKFAAFADALQALVTGEGKASPLAINRLLAAQAQLEAAAEQSYRDQAAGSPALKQQLHRLSLRQGQVLVLHQMRPYGGLVMHPRLPLNEEVLAALDRQILDDMQRLQHDSVAAEGQLAAVMRSYRFVRPKLFEAERGLAGHGVDHYLGRNIQRLDEFAAGL